MKNDSLKKSTIGAGQLYTLLVLARLMHTMIYRSEEFNSGTALMLTLLLTTAIESVLALPLVLLVRSGNTDVVSAITSGKGISRFIKLLYSAFFVYVASGTVMYFAQFMNTEFPKVANPTIVCIVLVLAAGYCAYLGIEGLARAGGAVLGTVLILVVMMSLVSEGEFEPLNLMPVTADDLPSMLKYALNDLASSWWLPMVAMLAPYIEKGVTKAVYGYLATKLVLLETILLLVTLVLYRFVKIIEYPILALGAYAKTDFIQHFDSINMLVWSINCILISGVYIFISSKAASKKKGLSIKWLVFISAVTAAAAVFAYYSGMEYNGTIGYSIRLSGVIVLGVLLPLCALAVQKIKSKRRRAYTDSSSE